MSFKNSFSSFRVVLLLLVIFILSSCGSAKREDIVYFQDASNFETLVDNNKTATKFKVDDLVSIYVSSLDPEASVPFNLMRGARESIPGMGGDDPVQCAAVDYEVADDGKCLGAERLDPDGVAVFKLAHVQLADGDGAVGTVGDTVDGQGTHPANSLAAVVVEVNGFTSILDDAFVDDVEHLQKRRLDRNIFGVVGLDASVILRAFLAPDFQLQVHGDSENFRYL